jgi:hypothetical protein
VKIAIVGSREYPNLGRVTAYVESLPEGTVIVSGNAEGVDRVAEVAGNHYGLDVISIPADWDTHGKGAGYIRNIEIVEQVETVVAFWDGKSKGTLHTITEATKRGIRVIINPHCKYEG